MALVVQDVRDVMPNYENYKDWQREGEILGIAIHHSATADRITGAPLGNATTFFNYHVNTRGWAHGGYNYVITGAGEVEYALDDNISAYHAGFKDPDNSEGLEQGQYWNNHFLAICVVGWFSEGRTYRDGAGNTQNIPNTHTAPNDAQIQALLELIQQLRQTYNIPVKNVRGHRELKGNSTACPGANLDAGEVRNTLQAMDEAGESPEPDPLPTDVQPGEHVILLPDTDKYLEVALAYVWKFQPDVSFAVAEARGRWDYMTVVGSKTEVSDSQLSQLRNGGAKLVQRISGDPTTAQVTLDELVQKNMRFLLAEEEPQPEPEPQTYTIQPGDTLSSIALQLYGKSSLWRLIFEANTDQLSDPGRIRPGQVLVIPPEPSS